MRRKTVLENVWEETFSVVPVGKAPSVAILLPCTYILPHQTLILISKYHPGAPGTSVINIRKLHLLSMTCPPTYKMALETMESFSMSLKSLMLLSTASDRKMFQIHCRVIRVFLLENSRLGQQPIFKETGYSKPHLR